MERPGLPRHATAAGERRPAGSAARPPAGCRARSARGPAFFSTWLTLLKKEEAGPCWLGRLVTLAVRTHNRPALLPPLEGKGRNMCGVKQACDRLEAGRADAPHGRDQP